MFAISDFTHICRECVDVVIYALFPESFCAKNLAVRKVFVVSDSGPSGPRLLAGGPLGLLTLSFGRSGRVTHAIVIG